MGEQQSGEPKDKDRDLLKASLFCTAEIAAGVMSNRYASHLPLLGVLLVVLIPLLLCLVWIFRRERQNGKIKQMFLSHPASYSVIALVLAFFFWNTASILMDRVRAAHKEPDISKAVPIATPAGALTPSQAAPIAPPEKPKFERPKHGATTQPKPRQGAQSNTNGDNIQQNSSGPNSPNIAGSGNQISYTDTSQLPILSQAQITSITEQLSGMSYKVVVRFSMADNDANRLADDIVNALKAAKWNADWQGGFGAAMRNKVPVIMGIHSAPAPIEAVRLQQVMSNAVGFPVPGIIEAAVPDGEIDIAIVSRPVK